MKKLILVLSFLLFSLHSRALGEFSNKLYPLENFKEYPQLETTDVFVAHTKEIISEGKELEYLAKMSQHSLRNIIKERAKAITNDKNEKTSPTVIAVTSTLNHELARLEVEAEYPGVMSEDILEMEAKKEASKIGGNVVLPLQCLTFKNTGNFARCSFKIYRIESQLSTFPKGSKALKLFHKEWLSAHPGYLANTSEGFE